MHILLIEDDAVMAAHMADLLAGRGYQTTVVADGAQGLARAAAEEWDLIVGDRLLPGLEGLDVIERLRALEVATPILVVSALGLAGDRVHGLERGADDYLAKPFADDEFLARVHALLRRARPGPHPEVLLVGDIEIRVKARTVHRGGRHVSLSPKEFELLRCLAEHAGRFVPRALLLERVWKLRFDPQTNVVDVHVSRLRGKIDEGFARSAIRSARGEGYMLATEET
ncbi:MAG: response regulator transcription factor [Phyllobacteriaceae bacterium]|nr:response regulator transcription factor [Phyllobacteriaceae bacterium]